MSTSRFIAVSTGLLVAIVIALSIGLSGHQLSRPTGQESVEILAAVSNFKVRETLVAFPQIKPTPLSDARKDTQFRFVDTSACGNFRDGERCDKMNSHPEERQLLLRSWQDAERTLTQIADEVNPLPTNVDSEFVQSAFAEKLLDIQYWAARTNQNHIAASAFDHAAARAAMTGLDEVRSDWMYTYTAPWIVDGFAMVEVLEGGGAGGWSTRYALRKVGRKWRVIAVQEGTKFS